MPPKKKQEQKEEKPLIGRPGNHVKMGIVGMPNVGKSTLFNALSKLNVPAENYPFCTIDPSVAKVPVPDERFDWLVDHHNPGKEVSAVLDITDIAGLVKGASEGKGLGNAFLSHINAVDAIYHVCRAFDDKEIEHVEGDIDPIRDLTIISNELIIKDLAKVSDIVQTLGTRVERGIEKSKEKKQELETLRKVKALLEDWKDVRQGDWSGKDIHVLNEHHFLSSKPIVYLVNISQKHFLKQKNKWFKPIHEWVQKRSPGSPIIPFSAALEGDLVSMGPEAAAEHLKELKSKSMIEKIIKTGYHTLRLVHYFTCGPDEVKAWTIRQGTCAPGAAGVIHGDFEKFFIMAECMDYEVYHELESESAVKKAGKYRQEGKNYVVKDGDIIFFKHNAGGAKKGKK